MSEAASTEDKALDTTPLRAEDFQGLCHTHVTLITRRLRLKPVDSDDLYNTCLINLWRIAPNYKPALSAKKTYAIMAIRSATSEWVRKRRYGMKRADGTRILCLTATDAQIRSKFEKSKDMTGLDTAVFDTGDLRPSTHRWFKKKKSGKRMKPTCVINLGHPGLKADVERADSIRLARKLIKRVFDYLPPNHVTRVRRLFGLNNHREWSPREVADKDRVTRNAVELSFKAVKRAFVERFTDDPRFRSAVMSCIDLPDT